jgi:hypothetical protein
MKRAVFSLGFAGLFVFLLMTLMSAGETFASVIATLLMPGFYVSLAGKLFGLDCANADGIRPELTCMSIALTADWFIYAALFYGVSFLFWHPRRKAEPDGEHNIAGTTISIS